MNDEHRYLVSRQHPNQRSLILLCSMISRALKDKARAARPTFTGQNLRLHQNVALLMSNRRAT